MIQDNIKYYCARQGIRYADLADRLNITRQTLHAQGTGAPSLSSIEKIARALNIEPWKLLHPDPASIETPPAPSLCCPICGGRLTVRIEPADQPQTGQAASIAPGQPSPFYESRTDSASQDTPPAQPGKLF